MPRIKVYLLEDGTYQILRRPNNQREGRVKVQAVETQERAKAEARKLAKEPPDNGSVGATLLSG